jgi:WD40 repeat protein
MVWDVITGKELQWFETSPHIAQRLAFAPDSRSLAIGCGDGAALVVRNLESGEPVGPKYVGHAGYPTHCALLPGDVAVIGDSVGAVCAWDARTGRRRWISHHGIVGKSGSTLASAVRGLAASPDGKLLVTSCYDDTVRLWNAGTGQEILRLPGHGEEGVVTTPIAFTRDGKRFVTTADDLFVRVWDVPTGKALAEHAARPPGYEVGETDDGGTKGGPGGHVPLVSSGGSIFILRSAEKIILFDAFTGRKIRELPRPIDDTAGSQLLSISPDNKYLLSSEQGPHVKLPDGRWHQTENFLRLMDLATGKTLLKMPADSWSELAAFSPNGEFVAAAPRTAGGGITVRRTATGEELVSFRGFDSQVTTLAFSADNKLLLTGMFDTTALIWDIFAAPGGKAGK